MVIIALRTVLGELLVDKVTTKDNIAKTLPLNQACLSIKIEISGQHISIKIINEWC